VCPPRRVRHPRRDGANGIHSPSPPYLSRGGVRSSSNERSLSLESRDSSFRVTRTLDRCSQLLAGRSSRHSPLSSGDGRARRVRGALAGSLRLRPRRADGNVPVAAAGTAACRGVHAMFRRGRSLSTFGRAQAACTLEPLERRWR
jgi:hypothetical protein